MSVTEVQVDGLVALDPVSNDGAESIGYQQPYRVRLVVEGVCPIIFHRWSVESVEEKATAAKGSKAKKTDDVESYLARCENGNIAIPGEYLRQSIINAARYKQDPRSPRKSAKDLTTAGIFVEPEYADTGKQHWDYLDQRRMNVHGSGITRKRPSLNKGWRAEFFVCVVLPEYIDSHLLHDLVTKAGKLIGMADSRPSYGRFVIVHFEVEPAI